MDWLTLLWRLKFGRTPSWLALYAAPVIALLIVVVSLYPFSHWRWPVDSLGAFLSYPLPYYMTRFDNIANIVLYFPLGLALGLSLRKRHTLMQSIVRASLLCFLLSLSIEFVQQFLAERIASNVDIMSNSLGGLMGAWLGALLAPTYLLQRLQLQRLVLFQHGAAADFSLVLLVLWFASQINPSVPIFGVVQQGIGLPQVVFLPTQHAGAWLNILESSAALWQYLSINLFALSLLNRRSQSKDMMILLLCAVLLIKMLFAALLLHAGDFFDWINSNVALGVVIGFLLSWFALRHLRPAWQLILALFCLAAMELIGYFWPIKGQMSLLSEAFSWRLGHLEDLTGLAYLVVRTWPVLAAYAILWRLCSIAYAWLHREDPADC